MIKMSHLVAALLFASVSVAHAADTSGKPTQPAAQGATSVQNNLDADKSDGKADKGLTTAKTNITAKHKKTDKHGKTVSGAKAEKADHATMPDHPAAPDRPAVPDHPAVR
jgi:Skp family chaperone for outer membrane proteins